MSISRSSDLRRRLRPSPLATLLAGAVIICWVLSAVALDQSILDVQRSRRLLELGAIDGPLLRDGEWWRLLASQLLHVQPPHMLFNALCVLALGSFVENERHWLALGLAVLLGGTAGQAASVLAYPALVSSGASQAVMAICGAALLICRNGPRRWLVLAVVAVQAGLDIHVAKTIKAGHWVGFIAGAIVAIALLGFTAIMSPNNSLERSRER